LTSTSRGTDSTPSANFVTISFSTRSRTQSAKLPCHAFQTENVILINGVSPATLFKLLSNACRPEPRSCGAQNPSQNSTISSSGKLSQFTGSATSPSTILPTASVRTSDSLPTQSICTPEHEKARVH